MSASRSGSGRTRRLTTLAVAVSLLIQGVLIPRALADISYIYDDLGRLVGVVNPGTGTAIYTYDAVGNLLSIGRQPTSVTSMIEFRPKSGPVGTTVTILGSGFSTTPSLNIVTFNAVTASVTSATATQLVVTVPASATTGPISVTAPGGSSTSAASFTVTSSAAGPPTITSVSPTIGTPGTPVTIMGTNFDPVAVDNEVAFNVRLASVSSGTATTLVTSVPAATGSGHISVATPAGKTVTSSDFFVPPSPYVASDVTVTGRMSIGGASQTVTLSTPDTIALILFDATPGATLLSFTNIAVSAFVTVYKPDNTSLVGTFVGNGTTFLRLVIPTAGAYAILVAPGVNTTGSLTLALTTTPDLTPTSLTAPASVTAQQTIQVSWTVTNQGVASAPPSWSDFLYFSSDRFCCYSDDTYLASFFNSTALAPAASYTYTATSVRIPNVAPGNYYLILTTDYAQSVFESNETNNQLIVPITVSP